MTKKHFPVLLNEVLEFLEPIADGVYIDATLGLGGHSESLLKVVNKGKVISIDQDVEAIKFAKTKLEKYKNSIIVKSNFSNIKNILKELQVDKVDGILFDLGTSYYQLTDNERGFSYHGESELDMRMDLNQQLDAKIVLNEYSQSELEKILWEYGEEKSSRKLAAAIVEYRKSKPIKFNYEFNEIIKKVKGWNPNKHPSKNIYQAIRIEVNDELNILKKTLNDSLELLKVGGKLAVITFHSLEDKIVKEVFINAKTKKIDTVFKTEYQFKTHKTEYPTKEEIEVNNASRSAKLRKITKNYE